MIPRLRPLQWQDIEAVHEIDVAAFPRTAWTVEMFWSELAGVPETRYYVAADEEGSIVGYAGMMSVGAEADVQTIAVHPDLRRSGLGQRLLDDLIEQARLRGCTRLFLEVASDNDAAQQLYVQSGFDTIARRSNYYAPGVDALVMRLVIDGRREQ